LLVILNKHQIMKQQFQDIQYLYKINNAIVERSLLQPRQRVLIAVSGGQDSICLLMILHHLKIKWKWTLGIVHCDHRWSEYSELQAKHVARLAIGMQIDYYQSVSVKSVQKETLARNWRYEIIKTIAIKHKYTAIVTAHSGSDRIETLIYHLMRGTGLQGIQSINWKRQVSFIRYIMWRNRTSNDNIVWKKVLYYKTNNSIIPFKDIPYLEIVRPLLDSTRSEMRMLLDLWQLPSWLDSSNQILKIRRNRIRHQLLPYIRLHYNPQIDQALGRWSEIAHSENFYLERLGFFLLCKLKLKSNSFLYDISTNGINIEVLRSFPIVLQRRILKLFIFTNIKMNLSFRSIEHIRFFFLCHNKSKYLNKNINRNKKYRSIHLPGKGKLLICQNILLYLS
jgi:tRNA(Ile)-lysidine synthase